MTLQLTQNILDTLRHHALNLLETQGYLVAWAADFIGDVYVEVRTDGVDVVYVMTDFSETFVTDNYSRALRALQHAF
jgi:hypothetical protein